TFNATSHDAMAMVIVTLQVFAGMWINAFIVSVLCITWVKKKSFQSNEKILLLLGCCRFWDLCIIWIYTFLSLIYPWCFYVRPIPQLFSAIQCFFNTCNLWVSACLCVFYCVKIANFRHAFFIFLKVNVSRIVPWLLLGSVLLSLILGILGYDITNIHLNSTTSRNFWKLRVRMDEHLFPVAFISGIIFATAFMAVIVSALLLLISLWRHKRRMQTNALKTLSMDAHIRAIKSVLFFFIIYSITFTGFLLSLIYATKNDILTTFLILTFQYALSVAHSLILIFSNPKLGKTLLRALPCLKCK
ncbi:TA2R9 protein, partial [Baryphthengus martii]|nr:TA2R9 protein [Baryphthengus martii]